jgi:hypothetical protein
MGKDDKRKADIPQMPFDDALRRILAAPPIHKKAKKITKRRRKNSPSAGG